VARDDAARADKAADEVGTRPAAPTRAQPSLMQRLRWPLMIGGPVLILLIVGYFMLTGGRTEDTDDAYVQASLVPVSASVGGRVIELDVRDNQHVKAGQVLFKLDTRDFAATEAQAQAQYAAARQQVDSLRAAYQLQLANVKTAQVTASFDDTEVARQQALMSAGVASRDAYDTAVHNAQVAHQQIVTAQQAAAQALANLGAGADATDSAPAVMQAKAALSRAQLNVGYGVIVAPQDGVVTRVDQLQVGSYVNPAQTLFWLVAGEPWITANFKENQLAKMRVGQHADIHIDAYPGTTFSGHVGSFAPGAGQAFSPLPAQNATGNWVKVVQRLPVRVDFDQPPPEMAGRAGLSANVTVDVKGDTHRQAAAPQ
jgi:membrane fusion protein (multidrug efflux system)